MIRTSNLNYAYKSGESMTFPDMECNQGEKMLILGPSGSGKTTLLHLLGGIIRPQKGQITIKETNINGLSNNDLDRFRGKNIGIILQQSYFVKSLSVVENLMLAQSMAGYKVDKQKCLDILERLDIVSKQNKKPTQLSVGEQQRASIARALINTPGIILADEPTSALDDENCEKVRVLLEQEAERENAALIIVTHDGRLKDKFTNRIELTS
jgi:putative ABC transport system ATP-binding protein